MAVIIKGIDILEPSAGTNSLQWAWQNGGPASGEVLIFGENGLLTNGTPVASGSTFETTSEPTFEPTEEFYINQLAMNAADNLSNYPGFTNAMLFDGNYLSKTQRAGIRTKMTYSLWVKRNDANQGHLLYVGNASNAESSLYFVDSRLQIEYYHGAGASYNKRIKNQTTDTSSWYHVVFLIDTDNPTDDHKFRIYVNSVEGVTDVRSTLQNLNMDFNEYGSTVYIGARTGSHTNFKGYLANIQFIDGQALDPSYFGQYLMDADGNPTSAWAPKLFDGTSSTGEADVTNDYGTNGFLLDFSKLGLDGSGDIDKVYDTAPISGSHSAANDWTAH